MSRFSIHRRTFFRRAFTILITLGLFSTGTAIASAQSNSSSTEHVRAGIGLNGYCPVCIIAGKKWVPGNSRYQAALDGKTYYFPSDKERQMFLANPAKYAPALGGDCVVCFAKTGKHMPGSVYHAALYENRLFLFPSDKQKKEFLAHPQKYADVDLAFEGRCAVCLAKAGKDVPGKPEFTVIYQGFRYQFPSTKERNIFLTNPASFAVKSVATDVERTVTISGESTCASCEHGVTPIRAKDTMGLAINTADGKVVVVEDAHKLYPTIYKKRFDGLRLQVSGKVLQRQGKFWWIQPTELRALN